MGKPGNGDGHYGKALSTARPSGGLLAERVVPKGCSRFPLHTLGLRLEYSNIQYALSLTVEVGLGLRVWQCDVSEMNFNFSSA